MPDLGPSAHNGDAMSAEDVKFSFERYRGAAATLFKDKVAAVEVVDPLRARFRLKEPWPDFMALYATPATGGPDETTRPAMLKAR